MLWLIWEGLFSFYLSKHHGMKPLAEQQPYHSNGIRFSISDLSPPTSRLLPCLYRHRAGISLYDALHSSLPGSKEYYFDTDTISSVSKHLSSFKRTCDAYGVRPENIGVFATEAMRTALNRNKMTEEIKKQSGLDVDILSPQVESLLGAMGARSGFENVRGLMMDLGGGSVQMCYMDSSPAAILALQNAENGNGDTYWSKTAACAKSMPFGAAIMTAKLKTEDIHEIRTDMRARFQETFQGLRQSFPELKEHVEDKGVTIYFCGGGFRGYGSMLMHTDPINPYPIPSIAGYKVSGKRFKQTKDMLKVNKEEKEKIHGMSKRRREQFPAIVEVVEGIISTVLNIKEVVFCGGGNREGVLYLKLSQEIQESKPLLYLPSTFNEKKSDAIRSIADILASALPRGRPGFITTEILIYVAKHMWERMADVSHLNASRALHAPISGPIAGMPGLTHDIIAILSLILTARWENNLEKVDRSTFEGLRKLLGNDAAWWCEYLGAIARLVCELYPAFPAGGLGGRLTFEAEWTSGMGKMGRKEGVRCGLFFDGEDRERRDVDLSNVLGKVGKGLGLKRRVEVFFAGSFEDLSVEVLKRV